MTQAFDIFIRALEHLGCKPKVSGHRGTARCPAHRDDSPSLSIGSGGSGRILVHCHAGCSVESVLEAMGGGWEMLFESDDPWPGRDATWDDPRALRYRPHFLPLDILEEEVKRQGGQVKPREPPDRGMTPRLSPRL